ncbi:hypothetical protein TREMEDRAFT_42131 [Tremella mesenterica DSM 1558]|uniref:uncharacterized protein n=1 Tax=Tremella mesenterica (strain ATCC 24925 / CBS 8224 / DSM 1558 / NBRC 9311 / NRRL Y-6157 / RJB 2259-6 / UBC 559-6) TaxID=578456 RepID=UPI0003F4A2B0|nr:uncharacterized protein TREMEDRAFT_42131 [Tremella mesenterica DSM 1558]EIW72981.1 hypothetical protein TREMEDRAFT_42131 [Tremella mesenterica DSM 1558]
MADPINWLLLVSLVVIVIVSAAFLFYWNRLLGWLVAWAVRLFTWRVYHAYIVIGSLQVSPLAGRIAFRDVEYHSSNLTKLPCRIAITAEGLEAFVFNRTPAYDAIVERMKKHERESKEFSGVSEETLRTNTQENERSRSRLRKVAKTTSHTSSFPSSNNLHKTGSVPGAAHDLPYTIKPMNKPTKDGVDWFCEALPMDIRISTGSLVLGSDATPMVLIADFKKAQGTLNVTESRSICDLYKLEMDMSFEKPHVLMRTNVDYSGPLLAHGRKAYDELLKQDRDIAKQPPSSISTFPGFHTLAKKFSFLYNPKFSTPPVLGLPQDRIWRGLARYREPDMTTPKTPKREDREYAKKTTLLVSDRVDVLYYSDAPGPVPRPEEIIEPDKHDELGNVDLPPEYGIDITIYGGDVTYGPWADRQRDALQKAFAPSIFFDSEPKPRLKFGETRIHSALVLNIFLERDTKLILPTREPSKDWQFDGLGKVERKYGWLEITAGANSSIIYTQSQFATTHGYDAMLVLNLDSLDISSSVAYQSFINAKSCRLSMTMPTPLRWDAQRDWGLDVAVESPTITLLRDHTTLISDLARDWSSGATGDFHHFVPNHYNFRVILLDYCFHLFVNDFNIVDDPKSRDGNAFMDVYGPRLESYIAVAATQYRPEFSTVPFTVDLSDARVELGLPTWDTHRSFDSPDPIEIGKIGHLKASGSYRYYSVPSPEHQETMTLHLEGSQVIFKSMGWVLRRLFCIKDNYFGGFTQYSNLNEFLERFDHDPNSVGDPVEEKYRPGRSDPYAVFVTMNIEDSLILLPDEIYGCTRGLAMPVPQLQMNLKSIEHFMELSLDALPTYIVPLDDFTPAYSYGKVSIVNSKEVIFIEGITLKATRLFGPQPRATTYLCLWEAVLPRISAFVSPEMAKTIGIAVQALLYNFEDVDNAPTEVYIQKSAPDVTFFKLSIDQTNMALFVNNAIATVELPAGVNLDTSTWATRTCKSTLGLVLPEVEVSLLTRQPTAQKWLPVAQASTALTLDLYRAPDGWQEAAQKQQAFIREQDALTKRICYLYSDEVIKTTGHHVHGVYLPVPNYFDDEDDETEIDDLSTLPSLQISQDERASSPEDSDADDPSYNAPQHLRRRSRSIATMQEKEVISASEESDTSLESSADASASEGQNNMYDMASALAGSIRLFKSLRSLRPSAFKLPSESTTPLPQQPADLVHGVVMVIKLPIVTVDLQPGVFAALSAVAADMNREIPRPELLLDYLLREHAESIEKTGRIPEPKLFDLQINSARIQASAEGKNVAIADLSFDGFTARIRNEPTVESDKSVISVSTSVRRAEVLVTTFEQPKISLRDAPKPLILPQGGWPLLRLLCKNTRFRTQQKDKHVEADVSIDTADIQTVTPVVGVVTRAIHHWEEALNDCPRATCSSSIPKLLYDIVVSAMQQSDEASIPDFMTEGTYGLHTNDQRNIRRDLGWNMLARLRHWLKTCPMVMSSTDLTSDQMASFVSQELATLDYDTGGVARVVRQLDFMKKAFGDDGDNEDQNNEIHPSFAIFLYLNSVVVQHHGRLLESPRIVTSSIVVGTTSLGWAKSMVFRNERRVKHLRMLCAIKDLDVRAYNSLLFALHRIVSSTIKPVTTPDDQRQDESQSATTSDSNDPLAFAINLDLGNATLNIVGGGVRLRTVFSNVQSRMTGSKNVAIDQGNPVKSAQKTIHLLLGVIDAALLQPTRGHELELSPQDRLAILVHADDLSYVTDQHYAPGRATQRCILGAKHLDIQSRPLPMNFIDFATNWKEEHYPHFQPAIEDLISLFRSRSTRISPPSSERPLTVIDLSLGSAHIQIRAAQKLYLRWEIGKLYVNEENVEGRHRFGIKLEPQIVGAYLEENLTKATTGKKTKSKKQDSSALRLPALNMTGEYRTGTEPTLTTIINVGFFTGILKPAILDRLLSLHHRLAEEMVKVVQQYQETIQKMFPSPPSPDQLTNADAQPYRLRLDLRIAVSGIRFGLRADDVTTTLLFEALNLEGTASNVTGADIDLRWGAKIKHLGLSLGHLGHEALSESEQPMRKYRSAYLVCDMDVEEHPDGSVRASRLTVNLRQIHTVMHVAALSEMADLIQSWSSDIHVLYDHRGEQVQEVKKQTTQILKKFESPEKETKTVASWFSTRWLRVRVKGFGIAVPLVDETTIDLQTIRGTSVPALLFSVGSVEFSNKRNETARFQMQDMALQFVDRFDQSKTEHFEQGTGTGDNHMTLPSIISEAQMSTSADQWTVFAHSTATNFKLSLAPTVADGVFKLIDLYEQGKHRIAEIEKQYRSELVRNNALESVVNKYEDQRSPTTSRQQRVVIRLSFVFNSGVVIFKRLPSRRSTHDVLDDFRGRRTESRDTFTLPSVSAWVDYAGADDHSQGSEHEEDAGVLVFNMAVHESENTLRPSILPFFIDLQERIERRPKASPQSEPNRPEMPASRSTPILQTRPATPAQRVPHATPGSLTILSSRSGSERIRVSVTLRIDKSTLRFSCEPDSDAFLAVRWDSGGFMASTTLGGSEIMTVAGSVSGVTSELSHIYAAPGRSCMVASAKDMAFSLSYTRSTSLHPPGLSIVFDTEVSSQFRLDAYSVFLIFTAVWIDNIPGLKKLGQAPVEPVAPINFMPTPPKLPIAALFRFRSVTFDADIVVSRAKLQMTPIVIRSLSNGEQLELDIHVGVTEIIATGDISGDVRSERLSFNTVRRSSRASDYSKATVLAMSIEGGDLSANMSLDKKNIVRLHLAPSTVTLSDDWKAFMTDHQAQVDLAFVVAAGQLQGVLRLLELPRLLGLFYRIFDTVERQNNIAIQRSAEFKSREQRKNTEPAPVTAAIAQTARRAGLSSNTTTHIKTSQTMRFDLKGIDIGVFNEDLDDGHVADFYRFLVGQVQADLKREWTKEHFPERKLSLLVTYVRWDTSDGQRAAKFEKPDMTAKQLIDRAMRQGRREVASLPLMTLTMTSVELPSPPTLEFDFDLTWGDTDGDFAILPNFLESAYQGFKKLDTDLRTQKQSREFGSKGPGRSLSLPMPDKHAPLVEPVPELVYRRRGGDQANKIPIPRFKLLGEATTEAARLVPRLKAMSAELPSLSHRIVTLQLEEGMDLLLKLYEKQLPDGPD